MVGFYFITLINDFYRRVWYHILKHKNDTFEKYKKWDTLVGNQLGTKLHVLRTGIDREFILVPFNKFCKKHWPRV